MKKIALRSMLAFGLVLAGWQGAFAQTVTCDPSIGAPDGVTTFNDIFLAVASFHTGGTNRNNPAANVINLIGIQNLVNHTAGTGPQLPSAGKLDISDIACSPSLTFNGPATIILDSNVPNDDGSICANFVSTLVPPSRGTRRDIVYNNITFLPDKLTITSDPDDGFQQAGTDNLYDQLHVIFNDCILTSNKGDDTPSTATGTGFANASDKKVGDDWMYFNGDPAGIGTILELNGTIVTHCEDDAVISGGPFFVCRNTAQNNTRIVYNGGRGVQLFNSALDWVGSPGRPIDVSWNGASPLTPDAFGNEGISQLSPGSFTPNTLSYVDFIGNGEAITWIA
ncbi:MAG: hypothetical protein V2A74_11260, partial [bacterium]